MRWSPAALVAVCVALWVEALLGGSLAGNAVALLGVAAIAVVVGLTSGWGVLLGAGVASATLLSVADQVAEPGRFALADDGVFYAVAVLGPALTGAAVAARNRQVSVLARRRAELAARRRSVVARARVAESTRVTAEVDRTLATSLAVIVAAAHDPAALDVVEERARSALGELRELLGTLHEPQRPGQQESPPVRPRPRRPLDGVDALLAMSGLPLAVETARSGPVVGDVALSLLQGALLPLVRRRPILGAVAVLATAVVQTAFLAPLPPTVSALVTGLLLAFLVGAAPSGRVAARGLVLVLVGLALVTVVTPVAGRSLDGVVPSLVLGVLAWSAGRVLAGREARTSELAAITDELERTEVVAAQLAVAEQRADLARELHDVGAHALTVAVLQAGAAQTWRTRDPARAHQAITTLRELADGTLAALAASLGASHERPLLEEVADLGRVLGLQVELAVLGEQRLVAADVSAAAARIVQEALTNAARHAPGSTVTIELSYDDASLGVVVRDSGATQDVGPVMGSGRGLIGIRERAQALRGYVVAGPAAGGFEVAVTLPAPAPAS